MFYLSFSVQSFLFCVSISVIYLFCLLPSFRYALPFMCVWHCLSTCLSLSVWLSWCRSLAIYLSGVGSLVKAMSKHKSVLKRWGQGNKKYKTRGKIRKLEKCSVKGMSEVRYFCFVIACRLLKKKIKWRSVMYIKLFEFPCILYFPLIISYPKNSQLGG